MAKSVTTEKAKVLITGYQEAECFWRNVLPLSYKDRNLG